MKDKVIHLLLDLSSVWVEEVLRNRTLNFDVSFDKLFFQSQATTSQFLATFAKSTFCVPDSFQVLFDSINGTQVCIVFFPFVLTQMNGLLLRFDWRYGIYFLTFPNRIVSPSCTPFYHHSVEITVHQSHEDTLIAYKRHRDLSDGVVMNMEVLAYFSLSSGIENNSCYKKSCPSYVVSHNTQLDIVTRNNKQYSYD